MFVIKLLQHFDTDFALQNELLELMENILELQRHS